MNKMMVVAPYWDEDSGTWVFDDPVFGLIKEPFVLGVPDMIDDLVKDMPGSRDGFRLLFSSSRFPKYDKSIERLEEDMGGWWYQDENGNKGWLCPALFHYFEKAPLIIYVKAEQLVGGEVE